MSPGLCVDLYELKMAASYRRHRMEDLATFSLFVRELPAQRGFLVAGGLDQCLEGLEQLGDDVADLARRPTPGLSDADLDALDGLRFSGEVWAVPEGRIVFANEPILEVTAPVAEAQIVETLLLNQVTLHTTLGSKAARCMLAAAGRLELVEFGLRRAQGLDAGLAAARMAAVVGFAATSNVEASRRFGIPASGTMAHSFVEAYPAEIDAFRAYAGDYPDNVTLLVDTYDTAAGVSNAIAVIDALGLEHSAAIRIDSGDLVALARQARAALDGAGLRAVRIVVSGGLDEHDVAELVRMGAPIDVVGVGTRLACSADAPYLDSAYKLVAMGERPVLKLSPGKRSLPGKKQVYRHEDMHDVLSLRSEPAPAGAVALLEPVMRAGRRLGGPFDLDAARARFESDLAALAPSARMLVDPRAPVATVSDELRSLAAEVARAARSGP